MKQNLKLSTIYILGVVFPVIVMVENGYLADKNHLSWNYEHLNLISASTLVISILFCGVIFYLHSQKKRLACGTR